MIVVKRISASWHDSFAWQMEVNRSKIILGARLSEAGFIFTILSVSDDEANADCVGCILHLKYITQTLLLLIHKQIQR